MNKKASNSNENQNCWDCAYNDIQGNTFLGRCTWFSKHGKGENKDIPPEIVDSGCKYFSPK